jgi:dTDP-4-amino-4,6-dideoxygalactose transaminase
LTDNDLIAKRAKHITTTAKVPHPYEYVHDEIGFNYRMPNLNAALACAQLEQLEMYLRSKREIARKYEQFFAQVPDVEFMSEAENCRSNFWLNAIKLKDQRARDDFLSASNRAGVMTRPIWALMNKLKAFSHCQAEQLLNSVDLEARIVNLPSSAPADNASKG